MSAIPTFAPASPQAHALTALFIGVLIVLAAIFLLVTGLVIFMIVRFRDRPGAPEARQIFGWNALEVAWTLIPFGILAAMSVFMMYADHAADPPIPDGRKPDLAGHRPSMVVGDKLSRLGSGRGQRDSHPGRQADSHRPAIRRRHPRFLGAAAGAQNRRRPRSSRIRCGSRPTRRAPTWANARNFAASSMPGCGFASSRKASRDFDAWQRAQLAVPLDAIGARGRRGRASVRRQDLRELPRHRRHGRRIRRVGPDLTHLASREMLAGEAAPQYARRALPMAQGPEFDKA